MNQRHLFYNENSISLQGKGFHWRNPPSNFETNTETRSGLVIDMDAKTDFWRKTFYQPTLIKNNGHFLYKTFSNQQKILMETEFHLSSVNQFDQAGLMIYINENHWVKTGLEFVDGRHRLSCVVTNGFSDWSTQDYKTHQLNLRVYKLHQDIVVEAKQKRWDFIRIAHLQIDPDEASHVDMGLYACSPTEGGGSVTFQYVSYKEVDGHSHHN